MNKSNIIIFIVVALIVGFLFLYNSSDTEESSNRTYTTEEKLNLSEDENQELKEEIDELKSENYELQKEVEELEEWRELLRNQIEELGYEPYEL